MASRQEEKEKRRQERMAVEQQAASCQARKKGIQGAIAAVLVIGLVVGGVLLLAGGGSDSSSSGDANDPNSTSGPAVKIPPAQEKDFNKAASPAGWMLLTPQIEGRSHVTKKVKYKSNPPTSGDHNPDPAL